jgi:UDP-GlcNAc:undecaprenyl-phosphate GlcNAc-1-phosphate transferase
VWPTALLIAVIGSTFGFLRYNWHPARIFIGDSGALFLGFLLAVLSTEVMSPRPRSAHVPANGLFAAFLALGLPMWDMLVVLARRVWRGDSIFVADRQHIHHRLLRAGYSVPEAAWVLYLMCLLFGVAAVAAVLADSWVALFLTIGVPVAVSAVLEILMRIRRRAVSLDGIPPVTAVLVAPRAGRSGTDG